MVDIHADDYALSVNTSQDILNCIRNGRLTSISILPNMECFEECMELWRQALPDKKNWPDISIHLNFVEGHCLSAPGKLDRLTDCDGYFNLSWKKLFLYSFSTDRKKIKKQLKDEIKAQIERIRISCPLDGRLRIDSHQHTHMIPVIFDALMEVIHENGYAVEYIRDSRDFFFPYLSKLSLIRTYRPVNMIKVTVLNLLSLRMEWRLKKYGFSKMYLCGVFMSGKMNCERVQKLFPHICSVAEKRKRNLELLFHPGTLLSEEAGRDFPDSDAISFYFSENRAIEYDTVMNADFIPLFHK